jgi:uncharacterized protein (TIGR02266 family)
MRPEEKRQHPRFAMETPISLVFRWGKTSMKGRILNLSMGGVYIETDQGLERGEAIALEFRLPVPDKRMTVKAAVRWRNSTGVDGLPPGVGVEFVELDAATRTGLMQFIASTQFTGTGS